MGTIRLSGGMKGGMTRPMSSLEHGEVPACPVRSPRYLGGCLAFEHSRVVAVSRAWTNAASHGHFAAPLQGDPQPRSAPEQPHGLDRDEDRVAPALFEQPQDF